MVIWLCILLCNLYSKLGFALTSCTLKSNGKHQSGGILVILLYAWVFLKFQSDFSLQLNWENKPAMTKRGSSFFIEKRKEALNEQICWCEFFCFYLPEEKLDVCWSSQDKALCLIRS